MNYNNLKTLDRKQREKLICVFTAILNNIKSFCLNKVISIIRDIPEICKMNYKSYENEEKRKQTINNKHPIRPIRGEIYDAYITEGVGKELCGRHPVLIIQSISANIYSAKVTVLPIEGDGNQIKFSYQEKLTSEDLENNVKLIKDPSRVITGDLITIDKARLGRKIGKVKLEKLHIIDKKVRKQLGL